MAVTPKQIEHWKAQLEMVAYGRRAGITAATVVAADKLADEAVPALLTEVERRASWIIRLQKALARCPECGSTSKLEDGGFYHREACPLGRLIASL